MKEIDFILFSLFFAGFHNLFSQPIQLRPHNYLNYTGNRYMYLSIGR